MTSLLREDICFRQRVHQASPERFAHHQYDKARQLQPGFQKDEAGSVLDNARWPIFHPPDGLLEVPIPVSVTPRKFPSVAMLMRSVRLSQSLKIFRGISLASVIRVGVSRVSNARDVSKWIASLISSAPFPDAQFAGEWQRLMYQYSKCELTYPTDKLIALEGIAKIKMMGRPDDDTYVAGMWKSTALYDLPWRSWSWASVDGEIQFPLPGGVFSGVQECYAEVKKLVGHTLGQNGNIVERGEIHIEGLCLPLRVQWQENEEPKGFTVQGFGFPTDEEWLLNSSIYLEAPRETISSLSNSGKLLLLPLFATTQILFGIVLATTHGIRTHQRMGAVEIVVMTQSIPTPADRKDKRLFIEASSQASTASREDGLDAEAQMWSRTALKFIYYLRKQKTHPRLITIL